MANLHDLMLSCPGKIGDLARRFNQNLKYNRAAMALPAALSFFSALRCGRIRSKNGIEPNLYCVSLAPPGFGKTRTEKAIRSVLTQAEIKDDLLVGVPTSESGLFTGLNKQPVQLLIWDEFGDALSDISKKKNSPEASILRAMLMAFSNAGEKMPGKQYADGRDTSVQESYFNLWGLTNEFSFFEALSERFIHNGFLARCLIFEPDKNLEGNIISEKHDPEPVKITMKEAAYFKNLSTWGKEEIGDLAFLAPPRKKVIDLGNVWRSNYDQFDFMSENSETEIERIFWSRAAEHYTKLCLLFYDDNVEEEEIKPEFPSWWCYQLIDFLIKQQIERVKNNLFGDASEKEKAKDKFLKAIRLGESVSKTQLSDRTKRLSLSKQEKEELIEIELGAGSLVLEFRTAKDSNRKAVFYKRVRLG